MILFLILLVLLAIGGGMLFSVSMQVVGAVLGLVIILFIFLIRRRRQK